MSQSGKTQRPWREIAKELIDERNPRRIGELSEELNDALATQGIGRPIHGKPQDKLRRAGKRSKTLIAAAQMVPTGI